MKNRKAYLFQYNSGIGVIREGFETKGEAFSVAKEVEDEFKVRGQKLECEIWECEMIYSNECKGEKNDH